MINHQKILHVSSFRTYYVQETRAESQLSKRHILQLPEKVNSFFSVTSCGPDLLNSSD